jgi:hypothetical protein
MLKRFSVHWIIAPMLIAAHTVFLAANPARADTVQITLNNLTSTDGVSSEVFSGSFLFDTTADVVTSLSIFATGATDLLLGQPLPFLGVDFTGNMPFQFAFDDGLGDFLFLSLPSGLSASSYGFADASITPGAGGPLANIFASSLEATSGSFSISRASNVPEPNSLMLLCTGLILLCLIQVARGVLPGEK